MQLSLCIATFNEEAFIHYPLDSVYDMVDEVIIVDGGSTDKTLDIVRAYGDKVKIFPYDNPPLFHINKQRALEHAQGDWILQLDADETLSPELKQEIIRIIGIGFLDPNESTSSMEGGETGRDSRPLQKGEYMAYWLPRKNFFLKRFLEKGGQYPDYTLRLYKRGYARLPCKSVHENAEVLKTPGGEVVTAAEESQFVGRLKQPLLHYADPDFSRYLNRWDRYTTLDANLILERKEQISFFNYFFVQPFMTFFLMYFRHKGLMDGFPGFIFALFSAMRFFVIYTKVWQKR